MATHDIDSLPYFIDRVEKALHLTGLQADPAMTLLESLYNMDGVGANTTRQDEPIDLATLFKYLPAVLRSLPAHDPVTYLNSSPSVHRITESFFQNMLYYFVPHKREDVPSHFEHAQWKHGFRHVKSITNAWTRSGLMDIPQKAVETLVLVTHADMRLGSAIIIGPAQVGSYSMLYRSPQLRSRDSERLIASWATVENPGVVSPAIQHMRTSFEQGPSAATLSVVLEHHMHIRGLHTDDPHLITQLQQRLVDQPWPTAFVLGFLDSYEPRMNDGFGEHTLQLTSLLVSQPWSLHDSATWACVKYLDDLHQDHVNIGGMYNAFKDAHGPLVEKVLTSWPFYVSLYGIELSEYELSDIMSKAYCEPVTMCLPQLNGPLVW